MWEISPDERCFAISGGIRTCKPNTQSSSNFCYLGNTTSKPVLGHVFLNSFGVLGLRRAVAIFGGVSSMKRKQENILRE